MTVDVGPQRLHVTVENPGAGRPLLLINGIGATGELFGPLRQHFTDRETIAFDAPGVGESSTPWFPITMRGIADIVAAMVRKLGHDHLDVFGLSWGGALAQEFARRHPDIVRGLVLAATMPGFPSVPGRPVAMSILLSPLRYYSPDYLRRVAPALYGGAIAEDPDLIAEHAKIRATRPPTPRGYLYQLMAIQAWSSQPWLHSLQAPTLVLAGDDDPIIPVINAKVMAARIPDSRLEILDGAGHLFMFLRSDETARRTKAFLDQPRLDAA